VRSCPQEIGLFKAEEAQLHVAITEWLSAGLLDVFIPLNHLRKISCHKSIKPHFKYCYIGGYFFCCCSMEDKLFPLKTVHSGGGRMTDTEISEVGMRRTHNAIATQ